MSAQSKTYSGWPCPICGSFRQEEGSLLHCLDCNSSIRRSQHKIAMEYAAFAYRYGHMFRSIYEEQLEKDGKITSVTLQQAHPIAEALALVILSALHSPNTNWFTVTLAAKKMTASYQDCFDQECAISSDELKSMNRNLREFTQDFINTPTNLRNAIFEEIFAEHCPKKEQAHLFELQAQSQNGADPKIFDEALQKIMGKTFKQISQKPKPEPAELAGFWLKVAENPKN